MSSLIFPEAFKVSLESKLSNQWALFAQAHKAASPVSIRTNPKKNINAFADAQSVPWATNGEHLPSRPVFTLDPLFHAGAYYVQEASSMFLEQVLKQSVDLNQELKVLDLCAAPGGKTTHILSLISDDSFLVTNEVIRSRASILSENVQKWGYPNCMVTNNDPSAFSDLHGLFDVVVIDAPCSGEGMFRKDPDAMKEWSPDNVALCSSRQRRILHDAWPALKENGTLIYCTCTYNESENEDNLIALSNNYQLEFINLQISPDWNIEKVVKGNVIGYRFYPHKVQGEGFFLSAMRKKESSETLKSKSKKKLAPPTRKILDTLNTWIDSPLSFSFRQHNDLVFALPTNHVGFVETILGRLHFIYGGVNVATVKHEKLIPEHALALSTILNRSNFHSVDLDLKQAIAYLRRETIMAEGQLGYNLLTYQNVPFSWANVLQNRINNMYPQEWRIRMAG